MEDIKAIRWAGTLALVVMAGRTAMFVSKFDNILPIRRLGGVTPLSALFALMLILGVNGSAYLRGMSKKGERIRSWSMVALITASILDGTFNLAEAVYLANESGVFEGIAPPLSYFFWVATSLIGIGPTVLAIIFSVLAGEMDRRSKRTTIWTRLVQWVNGNNYVQDEPNKRSESKRIKAIEPGEPVRTLSEPKNKSVRTPAVYEQRSTADVSFDVAEFVDDDSSLVEHLQTLVVHFGGQGSFKRVDAEPVLGLAKVQTSNVLSYGIEQGFVRSSKRGMYEIVPRTLDRSVAVNEAMNEE